MFNNIIKLEDQKNNFSKPNMEILNPHSVAEPPVFPLNMLPDTVRKWVSDTAEAKSVPVDYIAVPLFGVISTLLGNTVRISPWTEWEELPHLWFAMIGSPSSGKTHSINAGIKLLHHVEHLAKQANKSPTNVEKTGKTRLVVNDATIESIIGILARNPAGLLLFRDELSGWLSGMNQYKGKGGSDRAFWLEAYNGNKYIYDRVKNDEEVHIPYLGLSVIGGIQPDKLRALIAHNDDDGFISRMLLVYPHSLPPQKPENEVDNTNMHRIVTKLYDIRPQERDFTPHMVNLSDEALEAFIKYRQQIYTTEQECEESSFYRTSLGKNPGRVLRIAVVIEYMSWAASDATQPPVKVSATSLQSAMCLLDDYFMPMMKRSLHTAMLSHDMRNATKIAQHIVKNKLPMVNRRTLQQQHIIAGGNIDDLKIALEALIDLNWLQQPAQTNGSGKGRKRSDYVVNPQVFD